MSFKETDLGLIPEEWKVDSLKNSLYIKGRIGWKGLKKSEYLKESNFRIINGSNITNDNKIDWENCGFISKERYLESPEIMLKENDIVMTKDGTIGKLAIIKNLPGPTTIASGLFLIRVEDPSIDVNYLFYYFRSHFFRGLIHSRIEGSVIPHLYQRDLVNLKLPLPNINEQKAIANILSTLDEKIETNNQINEKLEEMAQALFKHWFVDFEFPNENGKPYKSSGGEMVESELGMIPKGWKIVKLGDVIDFQNGYAFKSKDLLDVESDSTFRVFKMGNIRKGGGINHSGTKSYIERDKCQNLSNYIIKKGDLLMCMTDMKSNVALLGHTALMDRDNEYILNQRVGLIRTKDSKVINYPYLYILTNSEDFINNLRSRANSGVQVNLSTKEIKDSLICLPDQKVHSLFNEITERMFEKSFQVEDENQKLKLIRDTLLPKLMSGEIRVQLEDEVLEVQS
ncbi:restriction endonuclease subunit S [Ureibacillus thermosphaericus]|uniref:restriction endonuclease subunit S n=1 Tax=Ureibacillus thermosphaericus TaxID=51173 RepID=UPI0030C9F4D0